MWKYCVFVSALTVAAMGSLAEYTITPSNQVAYYHYPAPPKSQAFPTINQNQIRQFPQSYQQQQYYQQQQQQQQLTQQQQLQLQQQQQRYQQQQKLQQQSRYLPPANGKSQYPINNNQNNYYRSSSSISKQFASPALDNVAFNAALINQGYNTPSASTNAALTNAANLSKSQTAGAAALATGSSSTSLNIKLPLPFNITPLNIAPLPLQAGTPYSALPKGVTSYGTTYPQRKRR